MGSTFTLVARLVQYLAPFIRVVMNAMLVLGLGVKLMATYKKMLCMQSAEALNSDLPQTLDFCHRKERTIFDGF